MQEDQKLQPQSQTEPKNDAQEWGKIYGDYYREKAMLELMGGLLLVGLVGAALLSDSIARSWGISQEKVFGIMFIGWIGGIIFTVIFKSILKPNNN